MCIRLIHGLCVVACRSAWYHATSHRVCTCTPSLSLSRCSNTVYLHHIVVNVRNFSSTVGWWREETIVQNFTIFRFVDSLAASHMLHRLNSVVWTRTRTICSMSARTICRVRQTSMSVCVTWFFHSLIFVMVWWQSRRAQLFLSRTHSHTYGVRTRTHTHTDAQEFDR